MLTSSTGNGLMLRIKSFGLLIVPIMNAIGDAKGVHIAPEGVEMFVDSLFYCAFFVFHVYGWWRAVFNKKK